MIGERWNWWKGIRYIETGEDLGKAKRPPPSKDARRPETRPHCNSGTVAFYTRNFTTGKRIGRRKEKKLGGAADHALRTSVRERPYKTVLIKVKLDENIFCR